MQPHPAAELFPLMSGPDFDALVADIREHGQREPIVVHEGMILDGRNRVRACQQLGIEPVLHPWNGEGTPESFVISMNLHRRHLNESQRAMIAAKIATRTRGETLIPGVAHRRDKLDTQIPVSSPTIRETAQLLNVGRGTVDEAKVVLKRGTQEEVEAVKNGTATVHNIARQILKGRSPERRKAKRNEPLSQAGKNPERIQRIQMEAELWARVDEALGALTSLPLPTDVATILRKNINRTRMVDQRLSRSLQWLKDFENVWHSRD